MKLPVKVTVVKTFKGRIMHYTASLGSWSAEGESKAAAESALAAMIERIASEDGQSVLRSAPDDSGDVWMAMRYNGGEWGYGRWFRDTRPGFEGRFLSAGCTFGSKERESRTLTVERMDQHLESLRTGLPCAS